MTEALFWPDPSTGLGYARPETVDEALGLLSNPGAAVLAGGTDLVTLRAEGRMAPSSLVDIKAIDALRFIRRSSSAIEIGAATTMAEIAGCSDSELAALRDGAGVVGSVQTRNRATLGGNVCRSSPAGDTLPGLLVLEAELTVNGSGEARAIPVTEFFRGPGENSLADGDLAISISVPLSRGGTAYERLTYRAWMDLAVIGVAAWLDLDGEVCRSARVALGGLGPTPLLVSEIESVLVGNSLTAPVIGDAVAAAQAAAAPIDDVRGSREYRLHGIAALVPRVLRVAAGRAKASPAS